MKMQPLRVLAAALLLPLSLVYADADEWPARPIRFVQPATAGGFSDTLSRLIGHSLSARLGQSVVTENRPGAMNMIAYKMVSRAEADGYTLLWGAIDMTMVPSLRKDATTFDGSRDLIPVAMVASSAGVYLANPNLPVRNLQELATYAKANPGRVRNAVNGFGGSLHLTTKLFELKTSAEISHIPYRGTSEAVLAILSGEVEMGAFSLSQGVVNRDKLRVLAQTGATRHPSLPDVPTAAESGMPDVGVIYWFGVFVPPNTPSAIVERLARELKAVMAEPAVQEKLTAVGASVDYMPTAEFHRYVASEQQKWGKLIPEMGFKPE